MTVRTQRKPARRREFSLFKSIRYIGSKAKLLESLETFMRQKGVRRGRVLDGCAGSARVSWALRCLGFQVVACDRLGLSALLQRLALEFRAHPRFDALIRHLGLCNAGIREAHRIALDRFANLDSRHSHVSQEYSPAHQGPWGPRQFFSVANAGRIDAIRHQLHADLANGLLDPNEHDYILAALVVAASRVSNTIGHYEAYSKHLQSSAAKPLRLTAPRHLPTALATGTSMHGDILEVARSAGRFDAIYVDPPYNHRRHDKQYHVLERITNGWFDGLDYSCRGKTGLPVIADERSAWCAKQSAPDALASLLDAADTEHFFMSYSGQGVLKQDVERILKEFGRAGTYDRRDIPHDEFKAGTGRGGGTVIETIHYVRLR